MRKPVAVAVLGGAPAVSLGYLYAAWYSGFHHSPFHTFNDNAEWQQMDKAGHLYSSYQVGRLAMALGKWAGFSQRAQLACGMSGLVYLTGVEVLDGFSSGWGFSWGDMTANTAGAAMAFAQEALWREQRVALKFSYHESGLAKYNPSLLGNQLAYRVLKDYNGQTYWASVPLSSFGFRRTGVCSWLAFSVGYAGRGMTGAFNNNAETVSIPRTRHLLVSLDVDLTRINTRSKWLKTLLCAMNSIKIPAPALDLSRSGAQLHPFYF